RPRQLLFGPESRPACGRNDQSANGGRRWFCDLGVGVLRLPALSRLLRELHKRGWAPRVFLAGLRSLASGWLSRAAWRACFRARPPGVALGQKPSPYPAAKRSEVP